MIVNPHQTDASLLSVVTINLNNAKGLDKTIRSLKSFAGYTEFEFLFVDGYSTDNSLSIAKHFYEANKIISEPDEGIYHAMNKGLRMAAGTFVLWLNSGDELICNPEDLKNLLNSQRENNIGLLACAAEICYGKESQKNHIHFPSQSDLPFKTIPHQSAFFKRSLILKLKGYDQRFKVVGDRDLILRIYNQYPDQIRYSNFITSRWYFGGITASGSYGHEIELLWYKNRLISPLKYYKNILNQKMARLRQVLSSGF